jgi:hypothetical protein
VPSSGAVNQLLLHEPYSLLKKLTLALFMLGVLADHPNNPLSVNDLALITDLLY